MNTKLARISPEFDAKLKDIMLDRTVKKLCKNIPKERGTAEGSRLILRCPSWPSVERELRSLPKRNT